MKKIQILDSHTGGEPTRLVLGGFPDLGTGSMAECRALLAARHDAWRAATVLEPRGSDVVVGALLCKPADPANTAGVIFFNNTGYLGMCGHGTIGLVASLAYLGRIAPGEHRIETPVGTVTTTLHGDGSVSVRNVPAYRLHRQLAVEVPGHGRVAGDVAWGGNWFFITAQAPCTVELANQRTLTAYTEAIRVALEQAGIRGQDGEIDHIEVNATAPDGSGQMRNFVLCPGLAYDRSPCGTGTSAKLACLAADGKLDAGEHWTQQGVLGTAFEASYQPGTRGILPRIIGQGRASELLYTGRSLGGEEGERWGFFNRLAEPEALLEQAQKMAADLVAGPSFANGITKTMLHQEWAMTIDQAIEAEAQAQAICMLTEDFKRAYEAFVAKQKPQFQGN